MAIVRESAASARTARPTQLTRMGCGCDVPVALRRVGLCVDSHGGRDTFIVMNLARGPKLPGRRRALRTERAFLYEGGKKAGPLGLLIGKGGPG